MPGAGSSRAGPLSFGSTCSRPTAACRRPGLYFSEEPEPGEPALIGKAAKVKVWLRKADGTLAEVKLNPAAEDEAALVAECADAAGASLEGTGTTASTRTVPGHAAQLLRQGFGQPIGPRTPHWLVPKS